MSDHRLWCWEIAEAGAGPDSLFMAQVDPACAGALADRVGLAAIKGFMRVDEGDGSHAFIDAGSHTAYARNLAGEAGQNIWVYNHVRVQDDSIAIESGYGGRGEDLSRAETAFLLDILAAPGIALRSWKVLAGGNGYEYKALRAGEGVTSLRAYLSPAGS